MSKQASGFEAVRDRLWLPSPLGFRLAWLSFGDWVNGGGKPLWDLWTAGPKEGIKKERKELVRSIQSLGTPVLVTDFERARFPGAPLVLLVRGLFRSAGRKSALSVESPLVLCTAVVRVVVSKESGQKPINQNGMPSSFPA